MVQISLQEKECYYHYYLVEDTNGGKKEIHSCRLLGQGSPTQVAGPEAPSAADYYQWNCLTEQDVLTYIDRGSSGNPLFTPAVTHRDSEQKWAGGVFWAWNTLDQEENWSSKEVPLQAFESERIEWNPGSATLWPCDNRKVSNALWVSVAS